VRKTARGCHPWKKSPACSSTRVTHRGAQRSRYFLEISAAAEQVAPAIRKLGFEALTLNPRDGLAYDVSHKSCLDRVVREIRSGRICGIYFSPLCGTWSAAHGTSLRTSSDPWGHKSNSIGVREQNRTMISIFAIMRACIRASVPFVLDQPVTSYVFDTTQMLELIGHDRILTTECHFCAFGARWRKRSLLVSCNVDFQDLQRLSRTCPRSDFCIYSGCKHFALQGKTPHGKYWSSVAHRKPKLLSASIAYVLCESERHRNVNIRTPTLSRPLFQEH
jgi:hypothetical protein